MAIHNSEGDRPLGWTCESLGDLFALQLGKTLNKAARETMPQFPYLCNKDVQWGRIDFSNLRRMHFDVKEREKFRLLPGDLLVCEGGEIGRTALVDKKTDCYYQNALHRLRPKGDGVEPKFVYHFMQFAATTGLLNQLSSKTTIAHLAKEKLAHLQVSLPPLAEQRKIAAILSSVDSTIEKTQAVIEQVQVVKQGLAQQLLTPPAGYAEHGWKHQRLRDCAWVNPEQLTSRAKLDFLIEYLDIAAIERPGTIGRTRTFQFVDAPSRARRLAREGDILVSTVRPYLRNFARIREAPDNLVVSTGYAVIRPKDSVDGDFLYQQILSASFVKFLKSRMSGSNYPAVAASDVEAYPMPLPPLAQQRKFGATLSSLDDAVAKMRTVINRVSGFKEALISVLLTGELRVTLDVESA